MKFGVGIPHWGKLASPEYVREFSMAAEAAGYDVLWAVDHLVMPHRAESKYLLGPTPTDVRDGAVSETLTPNYEMMTTLTWVAAWTSRIGLGTGVAVLPLRNAVLNARQLATLQLYSGGRLLYGVGVGWLREEAEAMGMPWDHRGRRTEEHVALLRTLWECEDDLVEFHGEYYDLPLMDPEPRPKRPIPILIGGHSDAALERAGRIGDGWIAERMSPDRLRRHVAKARDAAVRHGRDPDRLQVHCGISRKEEGGAALVDLIGSYEEAGVDQLRIDVEAGSPEATLDNLRLFAAEVASQCH